VGETLRSLWVMIEISLRADTRRSILTILTALASNVVLPIRAVGLRTLTDGIVAGSVPQAAIGASLIVGLSALSRLMFWASFNVRMRLRENTQVYLDTHLMQLTAGIPGIEHHERPEYLDNVERVRAERWALANPFNPISWSAASLLQVVAVFVLLQSVHPLLLLLPLAGAPSIAATIRGQRRATGLRESQAESNRLLRHFLELTIEPAAAKEIRVFDLRQLLIERHRSLARQLETVRMREAIRTSAVTAAAWMFFSACFVASVAFTVDLANRQEVTVGAVMMVLGLGAQINMQLAMLVSNIAWLIRTQSAIRKLVWLREYASQSALSLQPTQPIRVPAHLTDGIHFTNVSFCYPGVEEPVLDGVDLHLPAGSTVAIVGENGAGKTTLVKLLSRFYEPSAGSIEVDGLDLRSFPIVEWRTRLAAGFQDFARLQLLARESVGVGDVDKIDRDGSIQDALQRAAAGDLPDGLPSSLDTQLGRYFEGGVDLSLGQWQKVALGRAMMRERILLLMLDEPTASLDAPTEHALFEHFATAAREYAQASGAITLLVSHRFSTVRMADLILVIASGRIVERGTHAELLRKAGLYAELYGLQARAYR
jgi:ATP-binding cassette, subfamily B, bacterial